MSVVEQPAPTVSDRPSIQGMVRADLVERERVGRERYGTALQAHNGRDALRDAYEEALDLCCYLRQALEERRLTAPEIETDCCQWGCTSTNHDCPLT